MKTTELRTRPVYRWRPERIEVHVKLCVLALRIQRAVEIRTEYTWRHVARGLEALKVVRYHQEGRTMGQRIGMGPRLADLLAKLGISKPAKILNLAEQPNLEQGHSDFHQGEQAVQEAEEGQLCGDGAHLARGGQWQRAPLEDLGPALLRGMLHRDDDLPGASRQVHSRKWICADGRLGDLGGPS